MAYFEHLTPSAPQENFSTKTPKTAFIGVSISDPLWIFGNRSVTQPQVTPPPQFDPWSWYIKSEKSKYCCHLMSWYQFKEHKTSRLYFYTSITENYFFGYWAISKSKPAELNWRRDPCNSAKWPQYNPYDIGEKSFKIYPKISKSKIFSKIFFGRNRFRIVQNVF